MGKFMKFLSILTGSSEETLHNARAEVSHHYGKGILSNEQERLFVFETLMNDLPRMFSIEQANRMPTGAIIGQMMEVYTRDKQKEKFVQIFNRVMTHYYNYEFNNVNSLIAALEMMGNDFEYFIAQTNRGVR